MPNESSPGTVYLVGAGPGDPELLTVRGARLLALADAVVHDALVNPEILAQAPLSAPRYDVGRRAGEKLLPLEKVCEILVELSHTHRTIVRLKGGDPFVFGRGGEEAMALHAAGVPFEVVPGVTAGIAALAYAGIPLTHRGVASAATLVTGHRVSSESEEGVTRSPFAQADGTLVVYMGLHRIEEIVEELLRGGRSGGTPAAIVEWGTYPRQRTIEAPLSAIAPAAREHGVAGPALLVVGGVVSLRDRIRWRREGDELGTSPAGEGKVRG
jgi:uroporphyrin-III C-methyltransferase